jgi:hypothetical protein
VANRTLSKVAIGYVVPHPAFGHLLPFEGREKADKANKANSAVNPTTSKNIFPALLTLFLLCSNYAFDGFGKERSVSRTYRNCRSHVQRLRMFGKVPGISGSRGFVPGVLRRLLSLCCSNSRRFYISPAHCALATLTVRLCECEADRPASLKRTGENGAIQRLAKIAAFHDRAFGRTNFLHFNTACWLKAKMGTSSPFFAQAP